MYITYVIICYIIYYNIKYIVYAYTYYNILKPISTRKKKKHVHVAWSRSGSRHAELGTKRSEQKATMEVITNSSTSSNRKNGLNTNRTLGFSMGWKSSS